MSNFLPTPRKNNFQYQYCFGIKNRNTHLLIHFQAHFLLSGTMNNVIESGPLIHLGVNSEEMKVTQTWLICEGVHLILYYYYYNKLHPIIALLKFLLFIGNMEYSLFEWNCSIDENSESSIDIPVCLYLLIFTWDILKAYNGLM